MKLLDQYAFWCQNEHTAPLEAQTHARSNSIKFKPPEVFRVVERLKPYCSSSGVLTFKGFLVTITSRKWGQGFGTKISHLIT
jgi:hypothetical protein